MVPTKSRLPREAFRSRGYRMSVTPFFSLKTKNNDVLVNRIGVVIGKTVDKRASQRNFWERQAKAELLAVPRMGKDIILTLFPKIQTLTRLQFKNEIKKAIQAL